MERIFIILPLLSLVLAIITLILSLRNFKKIIKLEEKLQLYFIDEINKANIDFNDLKTYCSNNRIKVEISSLVNKENEEKYIKELDECVSSAIERLMYDEQIIIRSVIDNSIQDGRVQYKEKVINDSISKLLNARPT